MPNANRDKGHRAEKAVAKWLRDNGWPDARTTRAELGHDGSRQPGDICGFDDRVSLEVKDVRASAIPTWIRQAERQAQGRIAVVVRKTPGVGDVGQWRTFWMIAEGLQTATFAEFCTLPGVLVTRSPSIELPPVLDGAVPAGPLPAGTNSPTPHKENP